MQISVNYTAILVAAIVSTIIGMAWYTVLFGKVWMRLMGISHEKMEGMKKKGMGQKYGVNFIATLLMAFTLDWFIMALNITDGTMALQFAFWVWLGFMATIMLGSILWENKPVKLYVINAAFQLVSVSVMSVILTMWR